MNWWALPLGKISYSRAFTIQLKPGLTSEHCRDASCNNLARKINGPREPRPAEP
jgi:hypothetical protein